MNRVSQQKFLGEVFRSVYGRSFQCQNMDDRILLQKAVFFMHELGVSCGDYSFVWDQYGPFSPDLSDDMKKEVDSDEKEILFNDKANEVMDRLSKLFAIPSDSGYSLRQWVETIASLKYMRDYMYPTYEKTKLIKELEVKKDHLVQRGENIRAMDALSKFETEYVKG